MAPTLYMIPPSPPVRAVQIFARYLGVDLVMKEVDLANGEHFKPEYSKLNPTHTVPVLVDNDGTTIFDSHAILVYLFKKYADKSQQSLYPNDAKSLALLHQMMHFDVNFIFSRGKAIMTQLRNGKNTIDEKDVASIEEGLDFLNKILEGRKYAIGDNLTIADFSLITVVTSMQAFVEGLDYTKYPNVHRWMKKVQELPACDADKQGLMILKGFVKSFLSKK